MSDRAERGGIRSTDEESAKSEPRIEALGLQKRYGPVVAVHDLSFEVHRGEILGLLGPNGAGKSTTLRMLIGFQYPDAGSCRLNGLDVFRDGARARASLGYLPESLPLYAEMSVREYLSFLSALKGIEDPRAAEARVIAEIDLGSVLDRPCGNLSRGYRQRVGLAQALLSDPEVLILDEPTSGLDPNQIHDFRDIVRSLGQDRAILLSTHILSEALEICDRLVILNQGRVVASGAPRDLAGEGDALHWARVRLPAATADLGTYGLVPETSRGVYRLGRDLEPKEAARLLALVVEEGGELLEWQVGSAGLEAVFRRLTLGEDRS